MKNIQKYKGKCIGIITPSRHIGGFSRSIRKTIKWIESYGIKVKLGGCFNKKYYNSSATKEDRVNEIHEMFLDKKVDIIMCSLGGDSANQILDLIDYELIKNNPKPVVGFSDITNLLLAINTKTGINTYHSPNLSSFSKLEEDSLINIFDSINRTAKFNFADFQIIKKGQCEGDLIGGNLFIIINLMPTIFCPDYKGKILFWEDINDGLSSIEYQLYQLKLSGILNKISGMIIGHVENSNQENERPWKDIILELTKEYVFPILKTDNFGHGVKRFTTIPVGGRVEIDTVNKKVALLA